VENEFQTAFRETSALLTQQNGFTRPLISPLLMRPILGTWTGVANDVGGATEGLWIVSVFEKWDQNLGPNYPFSTSLKDAELEEFVSFFSPHGALWTFYDQNLKGSLKKVGDSYVPTRRFDSTVNFSGDFLSNCLSRGRKITDAFFPQEAAAPKVEFLVNLHSVSENVSDVMLTIDGKSQSYRNTPEEWLAAAWPSTEGEPGAQLRIQGLSGLDEEIIRAGEFGVFRLLDAASKLEPGTASDQAGGAPTLVATYEFPSERAVLRLDIRAKTGLAVFDPELLRGYNCPRIITTGR
jgi:type VI protein secretion system component VasK